MIPFSYHVLQIGTHAISQDTHSSKYFQLRVSTAVNNASRERSSHLNNLVCKKSFYQSSSHLSIPQTPLSQCTPSQITKVTITKITIMVITIFTAYLLGLLRNSAPHYPLFTASGYLLLHGLFHLLDTNDPYTILSA